MFRMRKGYELSQQNSKPHSLMYKAWQIYSTERIDVSRHVMQSQIQGNYKPSIEQYYHFTNYDPQLLVHKDRGQIKSGYNRRRIIKDLVVE